MIFLLDGLKYLVTLVIGIILMENLLSVKRTEKNKYKPILIATLVLLFILLILDLIFLNYSGIRLSPILLEIPKLVAFILVGVYIVLSLIQLLKLKEEAPKYKVIIYILSAALMVLGLFHDIVYFIFYGFDIIDAIDLDTIDKVINVIIALPIWIVSIALIAVFIIWNIFDKQEIAINKNYKKSLIGMIIALSVLFAIFIIGVAVLLIFLTVLA